MASGLVNDGVETLHGYGRVQTALDVLQKSIVRKSGPFVKPSSSKAATKPAKDKAVTCAMSSAINAPKKRRCRGRGRLIKGLSPHVNPPPVSAPLATSTPVPAVQSANFGSTDARPQYRQAALARSLQHSQSGAEDHPSSPVREKQKEAPSYQTWSR